MAEPVAESQGSRRKRSKGASAQEMLEDFVRISSATDAEAEPVQAPLSPLAPPPAALDATQPVGVYLQWTVIGAIAGAYALLYPVSSAIRVLATAAPRWSQVFSAGAVGLLLLALIERRKSDRRLAGSALLVGAAALALLGIRDDLVVVYPTHIGWYAVLLGTGYGALHLLFLEDWVAGRGGPRFRSFAAGAHDLATLPWWFWFSKSALLRRSELKQRRAERREQVEHERSTRKRLEDRAAQAAAERKANEDGLAASQAAQAKAQADHVAADERQHAEEAKRVATEAAEMRAKAELRVSAARKETEELNRQAETAALERTRLRGEQLEAERRFLEAAIAAHSAAEKAVEIGVEAARAKDLLERMQSELSFDANKGRETAAARS